MQISANHPPEKVSNINLRLHHQNGIPNNFLKDDCLSPALRQVAYSTFNNFSSPPVTSLPSPPINSVDTGNNSSADASASDVFSPSILKVESETSSQGRESVPLDIENESEVGEKTVQVTKSDTYLNSAPDNSGPGFITGPTYAAVESLFPPRSSIPTNISLATYAHQCIAAAHSSRLNPYALHDEEQNFLENHLGHLQVTTYLNIRNGILRLWTRNPLISVTLEEAIGCCKDVKWTSLASFAYEWLVRRGYINFGCVEPTPSLTPFKKGRKRETGPTIVVIGAGMAGLGSARHLDSLCHHYARTIQPPPRIIVLEGRQRLGGRIHSYPLSSDDCEKFLYDVMPTAEMGAHIIVGFEQGNPLDAIIRGQLSLPYHTLRDLSTIYDIDGKPVDARQDRRTQHLYNEILERSCKYRHKTERRAPAEGHREMIEAGKDILTEDGVTIRQHAEGVRAEIVGHGKTKSTRKGFSHKPTGRVDSADPEGPKKHEVAEGPAAEAAQRAGWSLKDGVDIAADLDLDLLARVPSQNLGKVMDESLAQFGNFVDLSPKDLRLINWHTANLEYANNANVKKLSLTGWDQDIGNEFSGEHTQVIGGYQQLPRALWRAPEKLDIRPGKAVKKVSYSTKDQPGKQSVVVCEDGEVIEADRIVFTAPLGVLKDQSVEFDPPLPEWKAGAIKRLGFGVLNKIVLVFEQPFWDIDRDILGLLHEPDVPESMNQKDYERGRGKFFLFWNCVRTCGIPMLIGLISGDAAEEAEHANDEDLVEDVVARLRNVYGKDTVPEPLETIVTRWRKDRFARGSYSYVGSDALPGDYDLMAKPVGNLFFAGEATCGTHPATVHGAYLSGLRAASEVIDSIVGPIQIKTPLVPTRVRTSSTPGMTPNTSPLKRKRSDSQLGTPTALLRLSYNEANSQWDNAMWEYIDSILGPRPVKMTKKGLNPFLLFSSDHWPVCRERCEAAHAAAVAASGKAKAPPSKNEIRAVLGQLWKDSDEATRKPYIEAAKANRAEIERSDVLIDAAHEEWVKRSWEVKDEWIAMGNGFEDWAKKSGVVIEGIGLNLGLGHGGRGSAATTVTASAKRTATPVKGANGDSSNAAASLHGYSAASEFGMRERKRRS